jgi:hypothetical protein
MEEAREEEGAATNVPLASPQRGRNRGPVRLETVVGRTSAEEGTTGRVGGSFFFTGETPVEPKPPWGFLFLLGEISPTPTTITPEQVPVFTKEGTTRPPCRG